jgi:predicted secreted protein
MQRSKKLIIVSHCILNQNTVIEGEARSMGAIPSAVDWIQKEGFGIIQLPCPEFTFLGLDRPPMAYEQYDNEEYRCHCRQILMPIINQIKEYLKSGFQIAGTLGIQSSPSCDMSRGVFMEEFQTLLAENHIQIDQKWYLPNQQNPVFNSDEHFTK